MIVYLQVFVGDVILEVNGRPITHLKTKEGMNPEDDYINDKLLWARKYARIVVRDYYLFRKANSCPRAKLEGNCEPRGTDNVQGQLFMLISKAKSGLLSLLSFKYFLSQQRQRRENYKTKHEAKYVDFLVLSGTAFSTSFLISSPAN